MEKISLQDIIFVINPHSGTKSGKILEQFKELAPEIDYFISNTLKEFDAFVNTNAEKYRVLIICGGDGTINTTLKYLIKYPKLKLAVLPNGSGNGFARELGFNGNIQELLDSILRDGTEMVDVLKVNDELSCNMLGLGFDSYVANEFDKMPARGLKTYVVCTIQALFKYKPIQAKVTVDGSVIEGKYHMINIANTRQFGNNALIAPQAIYNDGLFDLVLIKKIPFYVVPSFVVRLFLGKLKNSKYVQFVKANSLVIDSNSETYHVDGEPKALTETLNVEILKQIEVVKTKL
ncbi:diacylglycerol/lipid kinase family protein [Labilibaculum antarcticum]|uniref:diacylglycerol/lipid kinase family protein n=1 Tax=Labilibaculum antarcticum TaxID=1717717 RepID=UPI0013C327EE|nr:diacylglycerol kinase family protein [Labilibaculum antarcticum]